MKASASDQAPLCFVNPAYLAAAEARARERSVIHFLRMGHVDARLYLELRNKERA
jgi:hypothetical protein